MARPTKSLEEVSAQLNQDFLWEWRNPTITYAFPTTTANMTGSDEEIIGFLPVPENEKSTFRLAMQLWSDLIARKFSEVTVSTSDIEFAYSSTMDGYAHVVGTGEQSTSGNTWFAKDSDVEQTSPGRYGFETIVHEAGHALGLSHMGNYNGDDTRGPSCFQDTTVYTIMSYYGPGESLESSEIEQAIWKSADGTDVFPQTPMVYDALVIQKMYDVSTTTRTGNTVYGFSSNITGPAASIFDFTKNPDPVLCIFDSAGTDTLNLSGFSSNSIINLNEGAFSDCNSMTKNISIAFGCVIENAIAGNGNDLLIGNQSNNYLFGGTGNDILSGRKGDDTIDGASGFDKVYLSDSFANYNFKYTASKNLLVCINTQDGTDTIFNVESFIFNDVTRSLKDIIENAQTSDDIAPTLIAYSPEKGSTNVTVGSNLTLTLSEPVVAGSGFLNIYSANGGLFESIPVSDPRISIDSSKVTINPSRDFLYNSGFYVQLDAGAFLDGAGNSLAAITDTTTIAFSTEALLDADDYPDDVSGTLSIDSPALAGSLESPEDYDYFSVDLIAGNSYEFTIKVSGDGIDPFLNFYDVDGTPILHNDDDAAGEDTLDSALIFSPESDGVYFVSASDAFGSGTGNYTIQATLLSDDFPLDDSTSGVVSMNIDGTYGAIDFVTDGDLFRVDLEAGKTYALALTSIAELGLKDPYLYLYDADLNIVAQDDDRGGNLNSLIFYKPLVSGSFFLGAFDYDSGTGNYQVFATTGRTSGTASDDYLIGTALKDSLIGEAGNDYLFGGLGADSLMGGDGNDSYFIDNKGDKIFEAVEEGDDKIYTSLSSYKLGKNLEILEYEGNSKFSGTGNELDNTIYGGEFSDFISGGLGDDLLQGFSGSDKLTGGGGGDEFFFSVEDYSFSSLSNFGQDVITDFSNFQGDKITLSGFGEKFDKFFTKTEAISSGSNFFFCDQEGVIYYQPNSDGNLFAIIKLIGKPYLLDSDAFEII